MASSDNDMESVINVFHDDEFSVRYSKNKRYTRKARFVTGGVCLISALFVTMINWRVWFLPVIVISSWLVFVIYDALRTQEVIIDKRQQEVTITTKYRFLKEETVRRVPFAEIKSVFSGALIPPTKDTATTWEIMLFLKDDQSISIFKGANDDEVNKVIKILYPYLTVKDGNSERALAMFAPDEEEQAEKSKVSGIRCLSIFAGFFSVMVIVAYFMMQRLIQGPQDKEFFDALLLVIIFGVICATLAWARMMGMFRTKRLFSVEEKKPRV